MKNNQRSKYWDRLVDLLDKHFPKGKSKERGNALVLLAEIEIILRKDVMIKILKNF